MDLVIIKCENIKTYSKTVELCCAEAAQKKQITNRALPIPAKYSPVYLLNLLPELISIYKYFFLVALDAKRNLVTKNCSGIRIKNRNKSVDKKLEITRAKEIMSKVDSTISFWSWSRANKLLLSFFMIPSLMLLVLYQVEFKKQLILRRGP